MATMSKRQQARNEKELQEVLRSIPGNNQCADCGARNPGWASWSLGIFLCMRCASIHRKLGTHISKVKSLSMDTWTSDQVESMKRNGNTASNKNYNPKNRRPDIPLDADEVDSAMERYIRKKYQEKSLSDGKPLPPARNDDDRPYSRSPESSPPPPLPPKKGRLFGFGLRAVSSAYPLSKHDKKNLPRDPIVDRAFHLSSESYGNSSRVDPGRTMSDDELQKQLVVLREMGFRDAPRNTAILKATNGNIESTVATLVRLGDTNKALGKNITPDLTGSTKSTPGNSSFPTDAEIGTSQPPRASTNPFDQTPTGQAVGLSSAPAQQQQPQSTGHSLPADQRIGSSNNPFDMPARIETNQGLSQAFQAMQLSQPLFPHSTGGYPIQASPQHDPRLQHSMTPPVPSIPHQYGYTTSPSPISGNLNPFFQSVSPVQMPVSNPYATMVQSQSSRPTSGNPFFGQAPPQALQSHQPPQQAQQMMTSNPFGMPPHQQPQQPYQQVPLQMQGESIFDNPQQQYYQSNSSQSSYAQQQMGQTQFQSTGQLQPSQSTPNFQYGQPQPQQPQFQPQPNFQPQQQVASQFQFQPQQLMPQQTGRFDKSSILALYNYSQQATPKPLASIPEPTDPQIFQQNMSPAAASDIFGPNIPRSQKRSATMPASSLHSAGGGGSRNPFLTNTSSSNSIPISPMPNGSGIMARHASAESVSINNASLESGRHSPDAFASLSARYMK